MEYAIAARRGQLGSVCTLTVPATACLLVLFSSLETMAAINPVFPQMCDTQPQPQGFLVREWEERISWEILQTT